jgi:PAS domain S-box-containing protein
MKRSDDEHGEPTAMPSVQIRPRPSGIEAPSRGDAYRAALQASVDAFFLVEVIRDADGQPTEFLFREMNAQAEAIVPHGRTEWLGRSVFDFFVETEHAPLRDGLARVATTGEVVSGEHIAPFALGELCVHYQLLPAHDDVIAIVRDITAQRREGEQHRASAERLRYVLEGSNDAYWDWNAQTGTGYSSMWWLERLGYEAHELRTSADWAAVIPSEDFPELARRLTDHLAGRSPQFIGEHRLRKRSGEHVWVLSRGKVVERDEGGRPLRIAGTVTDITQQKRDEASRRDNERRYAAVFNSAFQFTGLLAADGRVLETNQAALAFAGARAEDLAGQPFWEASWWRTDDEGKRELRELTARAGRGEFVRLELEVTSHDGRHTVLDFSLTPVRDDVGRVVYLVPEGRDITEKKQLEESVQRAEKMEAIGRMAGGIAHDFNNLLNVISGFNEILAADVAAAAPAAPDATPTRGQVAVSEIRRAVDRAGLLIQQLLVVSRRQMLAPVVMDVNAVVRETHNMVKRAVGEEVNVSLRLEAANPRVHADPTKLEHVGHGAGDARAHLRAFFHHQAAR